MIMRDRLLDIVKDRFSADSDYQWYNIEQHGTRVGKVRMHYGAHSAVIYSIIIFPEFEGRGLAGRVLRMFKHIFTDIRADRVRHRARGFWQRMDFHPVAGGHYEWKNMPYKTVKQEGSYAIQAQCSGSQK